MSHDNCSNQAWTHDSHWFRSMFHVLFMIFFCRHMFTRQVLVVSLFLTNRHLKNLTQQPASPAQTSLTQNLFSQTNIKCKIYWQRTVTVNSPVVKSHSVPNFRNFTTLVYQMYILKTCDAYRLKAWAQLVVLTQPACYLYNVLPFWIKWLGPPSNLLFPISVSYSQKGKKRQKGQQGLWCPLSHAPCHFMGLCSKKARCTNKTEPGFKPAFEQKALQ